MARFKGDHPVGLVGNLVLYSVNNKRYLKVNNSNVHQTKATKASAKTFGRIKSISAGMRACLRE